MSSRREFLKRVTGATTGMWMADGIAESAFAMMQQAAPRPKRREVSVGGRRVTSAQLKSRAWLSTAERPVRSSVFSISRTIESMRFAMTASSTGSRLTRAPPPGSCRAG